MNLAVAFIDNLRAKTHKLVDNAADAFFVTRNGVRGYYYKVAACNVYLAVIAHCHARKRRQGFALAAGCNDDGFTLRNAVYGVKRNNRALRRFKIAKFQRFVHNLFHASARNGNLAPEFNSRIYGKLHAVHI